MAWELKELRSKVSAGSRISCSTEKQMTEGINPMDYAFDRVPHAEEKPVIIILDPDKLESAGNEDGNSEYTYRLKKGVSFNEALIAIIDIKDR